jgi:hypothetical protein
MPERCKRRTASARVLARECTSDPFLPVHRGQRRGDRQVSRRFAGPAALVIVAVSGAMMGCSSRPSEETTAAPLSHAEKPAPVVPDSALNPSVDDLIQGSCPAGIDRQTLAAALHSWPKAVSIGSGHPAWQCGEVELAPLNPSTCATCVSGRAGPVSVVLERRLADSPGGPGRTHVTFHRQPADDEKPGGVCFANRAAGTALDSFSWMEDLDGDGRVEMIAWDHLPLVAPGSDQQRDAAAAHACRALLPVVYSVGPAYLLRSARAGAPLYERLARFYRERASINPALAGLGAALESYAAAYRAPAVALPAVSADGTLAAVAWTEGDAMGINNVVGILALNRDAKPRFVHSFGMGGTENPASHEDELAEYLARGGFSSIPMTRVDGGRVALGDIEIRVRGKQRVTIDVLRDGKSIGSKTYRGEAPLEVGLVDGPSAFLLVSPDWVLVPLAAR